MSVGCKALGMHSYWGTPVSYSTWLFLQRYIYYGKWKCLHNQKIANLVIVKSLNPMELVMKSISCAVTVALLTVANTSLTAASNSTNAGPEETGQNSGHHWSIFVVLTDVDE